MDTYLGYPIYKGSIDNLEPAPELRNQDSVEQQLQIPRHVLSHFANHSTAGWMPVSLGKIPGNDNYVFEMNGFEEGNGRRTYNILVPKKNMAPIRRMLPRRATE